MREMNSKNIRWRGDHKLDVCQADLHSVIYFLIIPHRFSGPLWVAILMHCTDSQQDSSLDFWLENSWTFTFLFWSHPLFIFLYAYGTVHTVSCLHNLKSISLYDLLVSVSVYSSLNCHKSQPLKIPLPQPDSSTCMHHSRMVLGEWWAVLCWGPVRHNTGWRSIFVSSDHIFCVLLSEL